MLKPNQTSFTIYTLGRNNNQNKDLLPLECIIKLKIKVLQIVESVLRK